MTRTPVYDAAGRLLGHHVTTYTPVTGSPSSPAPAGHVVTMNDVEFAVARAIDRVLGGQMAPLVVNDDDWPDDDPKGWDSPADRRSDLVAHDDPDAYLPDDEPSGWL